MTDVTLPLTSLGILNGIRSSTLLHSTTKQYIETLLCAIKRQEIDNKFAEKLLRQVLKNDPEMLAFFDMYMFTSQCVTTEDDTAVAVRFECTFLLGLCKE
jgi:hypothetical protein